MTFIVYRTAHYFHTSLSPRPLVDLAHAGERTSLDVPEAARRPVVVSRAHAAAVHSHRRNAGDGVLKKLRDVGGVIGLAFIPSTTSGDPTPRDLAKHARYRINSAWRF
nr:membrane dipeptidase [Pyrobaculum neutrophilum]